MASNARSWHFAYIDRVPLRSPLGQIDQAVGPGPGMTRSDFPAKMRLRVLWACLLQGGSPGDLRFQNFESVLAFKQVTAAPERKSWLRLLSSLPPESGQAHRRRDREGGRRKSSSLASRRRIFGPWRVAPGHFRDTA